jgi:hypothetical protein
MDSRFTFLFLNIFIVNYIHTQSKKRKKYPATKGKIHLSLFFGKRRGLGAINHNDRLSSAHCVFLLKTKTGFSIEFSLWCF